MPKQDGKPAEPHSAGNRNDRRRERPISRVYPVIDTDLARDNLENDLPAADRQDL